MVVGSMVVGVVGDWIGQLPHPAGPQGLGGGRGLVRGWEIRPPHLKYKVVRIWCIPPDGAVHTLGTGLRLVWLDM